MRWLWYFRLSSAYFDGLKNAGLSLGAFEKVLDVIPFYSLGLGWMVPAAAGAVIGLIIRKAAAR